MYSALGIHKNSHHKYPDELAGTHQKLDRIARSALARQLPRHTFFPSTKEILYFEGMRGPDGLKSKSPDEDEPVHFIIPGSDDRQLIDLILDHQYNLHTALVAKNRERAAFEAAWLAHAITDGLTPAHHVPLEDVKKELMSDKDLVRVFGYPIKGIMRGDNALKTLRNNWEYWGVGGHMSRHIAFEYSVVLIIAATTRQKLTPHFDKLHPLADDAARATALEESFLNALAKISSLRLYERFGDQGLSTELVREIRELLLPEIVRTITLAWYYSL